MSGLSSISSVAEAGSPTDPVQTYDILPKHQEGVVENSYDTPRSTRIWDNSRPSSAALDGGVYDSPRSTRFVPTLNTGLYDVPRNSQQSLNRTSGSSTTSEVLLEDRDKSLYLYDTPPSVSVAVSSTSLYESPPPAVTVSVKMAKSSESLKSKESTNSLKSDLHFAVKKHDGGKDIYSKPSIKLKAKPTQLNIPPQLPPRNSPRNSLIEKPLSPMSPDYMDISDSVDGGAKASDKETKDCHHCKDALDDSMKIINSNGDLFHAMCFVCAQCFQPFENGVFFEFEKRKYCQHDFQVLFAPCCAKCSEFITGRVIRALSCNWHPHCLTCDHCDKPVADIGFSKVGGRAMCKECGAKLRQQQGGLQCRRCHGAIEGDPLRWQGELYHPYHFNCTGCEVELTSSAREVRSRPGVTANKLNELYCLRCHDKMNIPICGACRRPIEERVVTALGKNWHVEHFACAKCEKPFFGHRHYERNGLAYCATHYHQLFGALCYHCDGVIQGDVFTALNKAWCAHHFACSACDLVLGPKTKFFEVDLKPVCKKCYEKYPRNSRLRLKKYHEFELARDERVKSLKK